MYWSSGVNYVYGNGGVASNLEVYIMFCYCSNNPILFEISATSVVFPIRKKKEKQNHLKRHICQEQQKGEVRARFELATFCV
jgi:hypothetical protein